MSTPPKLTDEQRRAALQKAAEARRIRADVKKDLKMGTINLEQLLARADEEPMVAKIKTLAALESLPGVG